MKTIIKNQESPVYEVIKRFMFAFQLLIVGIAIPLLFVIGISNREQKKTTKDEVNIEINTSQLSAKPIIELNIARI